MLEAAEAVETAVVLHMGGKALLADVELTRDFAVGSLDELVGEVHIDEVEPGAPLVGLELFEGEGHLLTAFFLVGIEVASEVVMKLHVLCLDGEG